MAQLAERSRPTLEMNNSNPVVENFYLQSIALKIKKNKAKDAGNGRGKKS